MTPNNKSKQQIQKAQRALSEAYRAYMAANRYLSQAKNGTGHKQRAGIEEAQAHLIETKRAYEMANEYLNAVQSGRYNPQPGEW